MQLTTINKIVSYLLVGSLAAALIVLGFKESIPDKLPEGGKVIVPLIFLASAAFLGCVIEGLRAALARYVLRAILNPSDENKPIGLQQFLAFPEPLKIINFAANNFRQLFVVKKSIIQKLLLYSTNLCVPLPEGYSLSDQILMLPTKLVHTMQHISLHPVF